MNNEPTINQTRKLNALKNIIPVLQKFCGGTFWLEFGTLLGLIRDGQFIEWDGDIDIGILFEHFNPAVIPALKEIGLRVFRETHWEAQWQLDILGQDAKGEICQLGIRDSQNLINLGIEIYHKSKVDQNRYYCSNPHRMLRMPEDLIRFTKQVQFYDLKVLIPERAEEFLGYMYGPTWHTPIEKYYGSETHKENRKRFVVYENEEARNNQYDR